MQDPQNFGALLRTAAAAGVAAVIIPRDGAVGVTPAVEKAAAGAASDIPICQVVNVRRTLDRLAEEGYWRIGLTPRGSANLYTTGDLPDRLVVLLGGEGGIRPLVAEACDFLISIPMARDGIESLNASVAGAVALFELMRRRLLDR
jgi:23S rRNA (guanosine2251-2'-O)-methyltransferase